MPSYARHTRGSIARHRRFSHFLGGDFLLNVPSDKKPPNKGVSGMLKRVWLVVIMCLCTAGVLRAQSQDVVFVQIEARNSLAGATSSLQTYLARDLPDVNGFRLRSGWYAIAIGPYTRSDALQVLQVYRREGVIPRDSFLAEPGAFRQQFFPIGQDILGVGVVEPPQGVSTPNQQENVAAPEPVQEPEPADETPREARASERLLTAEERRELQIALRWAGTYSAAIDGSFGRGTRNAMAAWQEQNGFEKTGILTTLQRATLLQKYNAVLEEVGMAMVSNTAAGISMAMPTKVVRYEGVTAPFARYEPIGDIKDARLILISQQGDQSALFGLYDILQTLEIVPLDGDRERRSNSFSITGENSKIVSQTEVWLERGEIKGFVFIWPKDDETRRIRILDEMRKSFSRIDGVLPMDLGLEDDQSIDLLAGLEIRKPRLSRSGFFVDTKGTVVTTGEAVGQCGRITLDNEIDAKIVAVDDASGIAIVQPDDTLSPRAVAQLSARAPRLQSEIAVAGFSFEGLLGAPSMTFGQLSDLRGLRGEPELKRLALAVLPGDAGGPVLDAAGGVLGMLLPRETGARSLPEEVNFAADADAIRAVLARAGVTAGDASSADAIDPIDLTSAAQAMTVLVSCWD